MHQKSVKPVKQAGAIAFRVVANGPEILIVKSKIQPSQWVFPKGHKEREESDSAAALRELREEAGAVGHVVRVLEPDLAFTSGSERVVVRYHLVFVSAEVRPAEVRERAWLSPEVALEQLTHGDAQTLLRSALPDIHEETALYAAHQALTREPDESFRAFLTAEYEHTADSLLRSEEDGEKRASFFLTLSGAACTALAFLLGEDASLQPDDVNPLVAVTFAVLLIVGYLTFVRLVHRNQASDRYKKALHRVRRAFVSEPRDPRASFLAFDPFTREPRPPMSWRSIGRGGWLESVAVILSLIAGTLGAALVPLPNWWLDAFLGAIIASGAWRALVWDANRRRAPAHT